MIPEYNRQSMSTLTHSRLFKATRRFIVAEITLIIVIVILFTWSTYVLYKLFAGDSDSLFGFTFSAGSSSKSPSQIFHNKTQPEQLFGAWPSAEYPSERLVSQSQPIIDGGGGLQEQLTNYKELILKELLARQRRLLGDDRGARLLSLLSSGSRASQHSNRDDNRQPSELDTRHLQQWRGGHKPPTSLSYLFDSKKQLVDTREHLPSSLVNVHLPNPTRSRETPNSLVYLDDAPSLMQLSPTSTPSETESYSTTTTASGVPETSDSLFNDGQDGNQAVEEQPESTQHDEPQFTTTTDVPPVLSGDTETTTIEPDQSGNSDTDNQQDTTPSPNSSETPEPAEPKQNRNEEDHADMGDRNDANEQADDERIRNTVKAIDEEVDRMIQPSLGVASQQDKPSTVPRGTVQFDDGASLDRRYTTHEPPSTETQDERLLPKNHKNFQTHHKEASSQRNRRVDQDLSDNSVSDLLAVDNLNKLPPVTSTANIGHTETRSKSKSKHFVRKLHPTTHALGYPSGEPEARMPFTRHGSLRTKRSTMELNQVTFPQLNRRKRKRKQKRLNHPDSVKRSDDDDDNDEDSPVMEDEQAEQFNHEDERSPAVRALAQTHPPTPPVLNQKQFITIDPSFEELLAHKQLLDALQQNQLPPPVGSSKSSTQLYQSSGNNSLNDTKSSVASKKGVNQGEDHESADTHYSVDHGLLLYPSADDEHHHKSISHKNSKASKKKEKKKTTAAIKKGGHKSKKHRKEEKKYHKEKKFKGAKKGKKMKKGKGGKGGKKGKKLFKDKGYKKKGFKNTYVKNEFGSKKSYFDEFRDKDFKKKWKNFDDKYNYAQMKKWQAKDVKKAKKSKDHEEKYKKYDKGKWKKKKFAESSSGSKKSESNHDKDF